MQSARLPGTALKLCVLISMVALLGLSPLRGQEIKATPQPQDIVVEETDRFRLEYRYELIDRVPRDETRRILVEAAELIESKFPRLKPFSEINANRPITIKVLPQVRSADGGGDIVLGTCRSTSDRIVICMNPATIKDGETPPHELVHALLYGNDLFPPKWLDEGLARYLEHKDGTCPAVRDRLIEKGALSKAELRGRSSDTHVGACGWIVVKYLHEICGRDLEAIARLHEDDLPEPAEAFRAYINWEGGARAGTR